MRRSGRRHAVAVIRERVGEGDIPQRDGIESQRLQFAQWFDAQHTVGAPTKLKSVEVWKLKPTNQGFFEARKNRLWEPKTE